jgi:hypothetical protein
LEEDAKQYDVPAPDLAKLAEPLAYFNELDRPRTLKEKRDVLETNHLRLTARVAKEWATTPTGQGFRFEHLLLTITNKTDKTLAYRIETTLPHPDKCKSKGALGHNALALKPGETLERTECLWHPGVFLTVQQVEVMELPSGLSYYYISRLAPGQLLMDERTSMGHEVRGNPKPCGFVPWREIRAGSERSGTQWADIIDFYARHNCDEYSFFQGYHRLEKKGVLPIHAGSAAPGAGGAASAGANVVDQKP